MSENGDRPSVGVAVIVFDGDRILLGQRDGDVVGAGMYQVAGGHLEYGEVWVESAARELLEETSLTGRNYRYVDVTNNIYPDRRKHYVTIWMACDVVDPSKLCVPEAEKCKEWHWHSIDALPSPLFEGGEILTSERLRAIRKIHSEQLRA